MNYPTELSKCSERSLGAGQELVRGRQHLNYSSGVQVVRSWARTDSIRGIPKLRMDYGRLDRQSVLPQGYAKRSLLSSMHPWALYDAQAVFGPLRPKP